ncbi:MAG: hypothetical protein ACXW2C_13015 [Acidimicrobiia bacterium]
MPRIRALMVVGAVALLGACSGSVSDNAEPAPGSWPRLEQVGAPGDAFRRIAASSDATAAEQTARFTTSVDSTDGDDRVQVAVEGAVDLQNQNLSLRMDIAGSLGLEGPERESVEVRIVDGVFYMDLGDLGDTAAELADGKRWLKLDVSGVAGMLGDSAISSESSNPVDGLEALRGVSSDVREIGTESVRGVETTHYRATLDLAKAIADTPADARDGARDLLDRAGARTIPVDVWLDAQGRVRKYTMQLDGASFGEAGSSVAVTYEFYDFGAPVDVNAPPADQVADLGSMLEGMLDGFLDAFSDV